MASPRPWTVAPHGPLEQLDDDLWAVEGEVPRAPLPRRMCVVRLSDGRLLFHNAVPLREEEMRRVEALGRPALLLVPNGFHRLDVHAFQARYRLAVLCPPEVAGQVGERVKVDGALADLPQDPHLRAEPLAGSKVGEAALVVRSGGGARASLIFGDTLFNLAHRPGLGGLLLRLVGSSGGPRVTPIARLFTVGDRGALASHLLRLADLPGLVRLIPSHGAVVSEGAAAVLRDVARRLG